MSFLFCRWWQWLQCNGRQLDIALFVKATTDEQKEILLSSGSRMNSWDHILLYCHLLTVLYKWFDWSGNCCIVVTLLCSLTRLLTAAQSITPASTVKLGRFFVRNHSPSWVLMHLKAAVVHVLARGQGGCVCVLQNSPCPRRESRRR